MTPITQEALAAALRVADDAEPGIFNDIAIDDEAVYPAAAAIFAALPAQPDPAPHHHDRSDHDCKGGVTGDRYPLGESQPDPALDVERLARARLLLLSAQPAVKRNVHDTDSEAQRLHRLLDDAITDWLRAYDADKGAGE